MDVHPWSGCGPITSRSLRLRRKQPPHRHAAAQQRGEVVHVYGRAHHRRDQACRALAHRHTPRTEMDFDGFQDLFAQIVLLQQVADRKVWIVVPSAIQLLISSIPAKRRMVGTSIRLSSMASRLSCSPGVAGLDPCDQRLPEHHHLHLSKKLLPIGLLLGSGELVIREAELLAARHPSTGPVITDPFPADDLGFPELY